MNVPLERADTNKTFEVSPSLTQNRKRSLNDLSIEERSRKKRLVTTREQSEFSNSSLPLTENNLNLFETGMSTSMKPIKRSFTQSSRSSESGRASRALDAKNIRFENALKAFHVNFDQSVQRCETDVARVVEILEKTSDSPEPSPDSFHDIRTLVTFENEDSVKSRMTPMLIPLRDLPNTNAKTSNLIYKLNTAFRNWPSIQSGVLPKPQPDFCVAFKASLFSPDQQELMGSPYLAQDGIFPAIFLEVKTALQGSRITDRQNANNIVPVFIRDYILQKSLGMERELEKKIRFLTMAHDTNSMWIRGWFYYLQPEDQPQSSSILIKQVPFAICTDNGIQIARKYCLNWMEHVSDELFQQLQADSTKALAAGMVTTDFDAKDWCIRQNSSVLASESGRYSDQRTSQQLIEPSVESELDLVDLSDEGNQAPSKRSKSTRPSINETIR